jgi:uncharacterized protein
MLKSLRIAWVIAASLFTLWAAAQPAPGSAGASFEGHWEGKLTTPGGSLRVVFHVVAQPDGSLKATMDSPDQGAAGIPVTRAVADKTTLRLESQAIGGSFYGSRDKDGSLSGTWSQGGGSLPLVLKRTGKAAAASRPQEPKPPLPYRVEEVSYPSAQAGVTLAATLTVPEGKGPFPAVLLVPGSGPTDRNETVFGHKPFLVLADYLTRRGIVVLRADKRGLGGSTGSLAASTDADYVSDALGGVTFLKSRKEVNAKDIGIAGHSEGGLVASRAAAASPDVAFIVLMAGPGLPGKQIILGQQALLLKASGADDATTRAKQALEEEVLSVVIQEKDDTAAEAKIRAIMKPQVPPGTPDSAIAGQIKGLLSPWYRDFLVFDPRPTLGKVKCPVLAIAGEKDLQVPPTENLIAIKAALKAGGNEACTTKVLPGLNHLFQTAGTGLPTEYGTIAETFSPAALQVIGDWILGLKTGA